MRKLLMRKPCAKYLAPFFFIVIESTSILLRINVYILRHVVKTTEVP